MIEIWVPMAGDGHDEPYHPDLPEGVGYTSDEGAPTDWGHPDFAPVVSRFNCIVDEKDIPAITAHLAAKGQSYSLFDSGTPRDRAMVLVCRARRAGKLSEFFATKTPGTKRDMKDALLQMTMWGVPPDEAEQIRAANSMLSASQRDGIDAEIHDAATAFVIRTARLTDAEASTVVRQRLIQRMEAR